MKVIIAGTRTITNPKVVMDAIKEARQKGIFITEVFSGGSAGPDTIGAAYAEANGITLRKFPAEWSTLQKRAGVVRSQKMVDEADAAIIIWDGESKGTGHLVNFCNQKAGLKLHLKTVTPQGVPV